MPSSPIPDVGTRARMVNGALADFLANHPDLELGGAKNFTDERQRHTEVFSFHKLPKAKINPIGDVEFTAIRGPHGTLPIRVFYPVSGEGRRARNEAGALIYFHGGGYTVGCVDEFENGLRLIAEVSGCQIYAVEYRLAPEFRYPVQLDEYSAVIDWLQGNAGQIRGVHPERIAGGGDGAGGNMTAAICLRRLDEGKKPLAGQVLLYPVARLPFNTLAAKENNSGYYLECNGIFGFWDHYLPRPNGPSPLDRYVNPGMQSAAELAGLPPAIIVTNGFDPLRDVGIEYAQKLTKAGVRVAWHHHDDLIHGWVQMSAWAQGARDAAREVGEEVRRLLYGTVVSEA